MAFPISTLMKQEKNTVISGSEDHFPRELLTKKELSDLLRCSTRQIERLQVARRIPFIKMSGRMIRYRRSSALNALVRLETVEVSRPFR